MKRFNQERNRNQRERERKQGQNAIIKWILIWEGVRISANIRHSPTSKEASEILKMTKIHTDRLKWVDQKTKRGKWMELEKTAWLRLKSRDGKQCTNFIHSGTRKTSTHALSILRNHSKRIPLSLWSIKSTQGSSFAFIPSTPRQLSTFSLTRF